MKKILVIILSLFLSINLAAMHVGKVFVDNNKNGIYDKGEKLLNGVMITDGLNVVKTNSRGEFELPGHAKERFITITTPSGYKTIKDHYIRINDQISSYDFALEEYIRPIANDGSHKFIQITDTEIFNTIDQERWANNVRDYAQNENIAFVIHTGDICYENGLQKHIKLMNSKNMGCPMYYCIGNHDLVKGDYGEQLFEKIYGPTWFSFDYGNVHYIVTPMPGGDHAPSYKEADVYEWLKNDLALIDNNTPIICFNHDLKSYTDEFIFKKNNEEKLILSDYNLKAWLYGHWHNHFVRQQGKVKTISTATLDKGGIDHSTTAFREISVNAKGDVDTQLRYTYINKNVVIASIGNENAVLDKNGLVYISVNAYNATSPVKKASFTISNAHELIKTNQPLRQNTDWNWSGEIRIPKKHSGNQLFVEATIEFNNGEIAKAKESFVYKPENKSDINIKQDWITLLGNSGHNGYSQDSINNSIKPAWIKNIKANIFMASPLVYNNTVYIASVDEDLKGEGGIYALETKDGSQKWFYQTKNSIKNTIAIEQGNIYAQDAEGNLYAINANTGKLSWEKKLTINGLPVLDDGLTVCNGIVYAGSGKGFAAYDAKTGVQKWVNTSWQQGEGTTSTITASNKVVIGNAQWRGMHANDAKTGKHLWSLSKGGISNRGASPAIYNGLLYFISSKTFFIVDIESGSIIVAKELPYSVDVTSTPLVTDKLVIFGTVSNGLVALDKESLEEKWVVNTQNALIYTAPYTRHPVSTIETSPVRIGGHAVFGASDGYLYAVNIENGKIDWKHNVGAPIFNTIAVSGNAFFAADFGGNVYAFTFD